MLRRRGQSAGCAGRRRGGSGRRRLRSRRLRERPAAPRAGGGPRRSRRTVVVSPRSSAPAWSTPTIANLDDTAATRAIRADRGREQRDPARRHGDDFKVELKTGSYEASAGEGAALRDRASRGRPQRPSGQNELLLPLGVAPEQRGGGGRRPTRSFESPRLRRFLDSTRPADSTRSSRARTASTISSSFARALSELVLIPVSASGSAAPASGIESASSAASRTAAASTSRSPVSRHVTWRRRAVERPEGDVRLLAIDRDDQLVALVLGERLPARRDLVLTGDHEDRKASGARSAIASFSSGQASFLESFLSFASKTIRRLRRARGQRRPRSRRPPSSPRPRRPRPRMGEEASPRPRDPLEGGMDAILEAASLAGPGLLGLRERAPTRLPREQSS